MAQKQDEKKERDIKAVLIEKSSCRPVDAFRIGWNMALRYKEKKNKIKAENAFFSIQ